MFDIGWSEMMVIALLTLIVIGPKELPRVLRTVGQWVRKAQSLARDFQRGLDDMAREADLEDAKKLLDSGRSLANPKKLVTDTLDPTGSVEDEAKVLQSSMSADTKGDRAPGKSPETPAQKTPAKEKKPEAKKTEVAADSAPEPAAGSKGAKAPEKKAGSAGEPAAGPDAGRAGEAAPAKEDGPRATVVKQPVSVAPPHSVTPPAEPGKETETKTPKSAPARPDGSPQSA